VGNKKERRTFDKGFKKEAACLITQGGRKVSEVARDLDIHPNIIHRWKREYLEDIHYSEKYRTRSEAHQSIFEYIEIFYNRTRRH
jgi:transposase